MARWFTDCKYSAFISFAHDDDILSNRWVTSFSGELDKRLGAHLRYKRITVPRVHRSSKGEDGDGNGPIAGDLGDELKARIAESFVMILVVHEVYAASEWCKLELQYFKSLFGEEGFRKHLYIVALSQSAITRVRATDEWSRLPNLIYMPFFQEFPNDDIPIRIYSDRDSRVFTDAFWSQFGKLSKDLADKIEGNVELQRTGLVTAPERVASAPEPVPIDDSALIYIESNQIEVDHWDAVGTQVKESWKQIVDGMLLKPPLYIRSSGLPIDRLHQLSLDNADGVVLLWGQKTSDSLVAQINKVEQKLRGPDPAPGVVAYLIPPQEDPHQPIPAFRWPVVRFKAPMASRITVMHDDTPRLEAFLRKILARKQRANAARWGVPELQP